MESTIELNRVADFFEIMNIKQTFPKVQINMLGNFHQAKTIRVIEDMPKDQFQLEWNPIVKDQMADAGVPLQDVEVEQVIKKEVIHQDNIFEIEMRIESDIEGGLDIDHDCIHGYLKFLQMPSYQVPDSSLCDSEMTIQLMSQIQSINVRIYRLEISGVQINNDTELQNIINSKNI